MKGKQHLLLSFLILAVLIFGFIFYDMSNDFRIISNFFISPLFIIFCLFLFLIGSILPDSDSNNKGSLIYVLVPVAMQNSQRNKSRRRKDDFENISVILLFIFGVIAYPMGWITNQLEKIIIKYTGRERKHRESLHTIFGVLIVSAFWAVVFYFIYAYFSASYNPLTILWFFLILFTSQFLHLVEDLVKGWKIQWK